MLYSTGKVSWAGGAAQPGPQAKPDADKAAAIVQASDCKSCHDEARKVVGPSFQDIAKKYAGQPNAVVDLSKSIRQGGSGKWGDIPMTPHPTLSDADLTQVVTWILSLKGAAATPEVATNQKEYTYTTPDGKTVKLGFPLFVEGSKEKVTKDVFRGYELFDSYCFRCHGQDVTDSELAPDLKHSLSSGMSQQDFISTMMAGREEKGMPSWAGFLTEAEARDILMYAEGRTLDLIPVGRPSSEGE